ncbi:MAG: hypothetical protein ACRC0X_04480 [Brevinema sp.]
MKLLIVMFMLLSACVQKEESVERELVSESKALDATYDIGRDLVLLQTDGAVLWYNTKDRNPKEYELPPFGYRAVYWNPKSNEYFLAYGEESYYNLRMTNGLSYELDCDKQETNYTKQEQEFLQYLGSITETERLYLAKDGNQYIKKLRKINDTITVSPVTNTIFSVYYTNAQGEIFSRYLGRDTWEDYGKGELEAID